MKILVVDDSRENLMQAEKQLGAEHELHTVNTFGAAKAMLENESFDLVMTDVFMPGESDGQGHEGDQFVGKLIPVGLVVALLALKYNIKYICIVSDTNHHSHPLAWAMDSLVCSCGDRIYAFTGYSCPIVKNNDNWIKDWAEVVNLLLNSKIKKED
jgi:hypothetical protein